MSLADFVNIPTPILGENIEDYSLRVSIPVENVLMYAPVRYSVTISNGYFCLDEESLLHDKGCYAKNIYKYAGLNYNIKKHSRWNLGLLDIIMEYNPPRVEESVRYYVLRLTGVKYSYIAKIYKLFDIIFKHYDVKIDGKTLAIKPLTGDVIQKGKLYQARFEFQDEHGNNYITNDYKITKVIKSDMPRKSYSCVKNYDINNLVKNNKPSKNQTLVDYYREIVGNQTTRYSSKTRQDLLKYIKLYHNMTAVGNRPAKIISLHTPK